MYSHPMKYAREYEDLCFLYNFTIVYDVIITQYRSPSLSVCLKAESDRKTMMVVTDVQAQHPSSVETAFPSLMPLHDCQQ
jgi:hypothetical protein